MSAHIAPLPHEYPVAPDVGRATLGKLGMWVFLISDAFSFATLLLAYGVLRGGSDYWRCTEEVAARVGCAVEPDLGINFTAGLTFILISSSVTMVLAYAALLEKNTASAQKWLAATILGGVLFLCGQMQEYFGAFSFIFGHEGLAHEGLLFGHSHYATTFYSITAFHGLHVLTGVILLSMTLFQTMKGKFDDGNYNQVEVVGLFWHFVDLVWILVFTLVYLMPQ